MAIESMMQFGTTPDAFMCSQRFTAAGGCVDAQVLTSSSSPQSFLTRLPRATDAPYSDIVLDSELGYYYRPFIRSLDHASSTTKHIWSNKVYGT